MDQSPFAPLDPDQERTNRALGIQNLPNEVPGITLRRLNDFAEMAGDYSHRAGKLYLGPMGKGPAEVLAEPGANTTALVPNTLYMLSQFLRERMRHGMGLPKEKLPQEQ